MEQLKLKVTLGALSVDYEGPSEFAKGTLMDVIKQLNDLAPQYMVSPHAQAPESSGSAGVGGPPKNSPAKLSTTDIAAKMGVKTGTELLMAAATYLHHVRGMEDFRRSDLLSEMKAAKAFYRTSHGSNLSKSLETLVKAGKLQNPSADTFALPYAEAEATKKLLQ